MYFNVSQKVETIANADSQEDKKNTYLDSTEVSTVNITERILKRIFGEPQPNKHQESQYRAARIKTSAAREVRTVPSIASTLPFYKSRVYWSDRRFENLRRDWHRANTLLNTPSVGRR